MYNNSIYPTKEQALDTWKRGGGFARYKVEFDTWFNTMRAPVAKKHVILIQGGCRNDCESGGEFRGSSPLRAISGKRIANNIASRNLEDLIVKHPDGSTKLLKLVEARYWKDAILLINRLDELGYAHMTEYINTLSQDGRSVFEYVRIPDTRDGEMLKSLLERKGVYDYTLEERCEYMLKTLTTNIDNPIVSNRVILGIAELFKSVFFRTNKVARAMIKTGAMPVLLECLRKHTDNISLNGRIVNILMDITNNHYGISAFLSSEGVPTLMENLRRHPSDVSLNIVIMSVFLNISSEPSGVAALYSNEYMSIIIECLKRNTDNKNLYAIIIHIFANILMKPESMRMLRALAVEAVHVLIDSLRIYADDATLYKKILSIVLAIVKQPEIVALIISTGGVSLFVETLTEYERMKSVYLLSIIHISKNPDGVAAILAAGGEAMLSKLLSNTNENVKVFQVVSELVDNIATSADGVRAILSVKAIDAFISALLKNPTDKMLGSYVIKIFNKLCASPEGKLEVDAKLSAALNTPEGKSTPTLVELSVAMGNRHNSKSAGGTRRKRISKMPQARSSRRFKKN